LEIKPSNSPNSSAFYDYGEEIKENERGNDILQHKENEHIDISTIQDISSKNILHDEPHHP
jgi:hypothetical protein